MSQQQIRVRTQDGVVGTRIVPIPHTVINATTLAGADTIYTVREGVLFRIDQLAVVDSDVGNAKLTLFSIPSGGSAGTATTELDEEAVPAKTAKDLTSLIGGLYEGGTVFKAFSDSADVLVIHGWGTEIL